MIERNELPPINLEKLEEQATTHAKPEVVIPTTSSPSKTWTLLAGPFMRTFIIIQAIAILIQLVSSFSSLYIVLTYPGLVFSIITLITEIQLHRGALVALSDPDQSEINFKLMKRLYWMYVITFVLGIVSLIITTNLLTGFSNDPQVAAIVEGAMFFIICVVIALGVIIIACINRYLKSIILTVTKGAHYHKSGSMFLMILCYLSAFSNLMNILSPKTENSTVLIQFAHSIGLEYVPIEATVQSLTYLVSLILVVMMARIIRLSREFDS